MENLVAKRIKTFKTPKKTVSGHMLILNTLPEGAKAESTIETIENES